MSQSPNINELAKALAAAQASLNAAKKDGVNPHFKSQYATLQSVWDCAREVLAPNGLSVVQTFEATDGAHMNITTTMLHTSGQWISGTLSMIPQQSTPQGIGSAITYGRRYALAAILGIVADEDDDGEAASTPHPLMRAMVPSKPAPAAPAKPAAQVPRETNTGASWKECPVPKFVKKGQFQFLGDMPEKDILWWAANFTPKEFRGAIQQADVDFREALTEAAASLNKQANAKTQNENLDEDVPF